MDLKKGYFLHQETPYFAPGTTFLKDPKCCSKTFLGLKMVFWTGIYTQKNSRTRSPRNLRKRFKNCFFGGDLTRSKNTVFRPKKIL
jgi:hypothetical protein